MALHAGSMQAMKVVVMNRNTLGINLAITPPFNCDFDGDEVNIHVPQSLEAQAELRMLSAAQFNIISAQASKPSIAIVQDSLLGAFMMTHPKQYITRSQFFNICLRLDMTIAEIQDKIAWTHLIRREYMSEEDATAWDGRALISMIFPKTFSYECANQKESCGEDLFITRGVLIAGVLEKKVIGATHSSILGLLNKEYGPATTTKFVDGIQYITNEWLLIKGFSIGIADCLQGPKDENGEGSGKAIHRIVQKYLMEADEVASSTSHPNIRELRILASLSKAKDVGLRMAKESLSPDNNFLQTIYAGSKGDLFNITQISGLLGQQNLQGQRVPLFLNNGRRTIPHYPFEGMSRETQYESRGFVQSSFIRGLNPRECYFHAMSGREGVSDTAMSTAKSGYIQRRVVKLAENLVSAYDGTVRDTTGKIFQMAYGENGLDPKCTITKDKTPQFIDVARIAQKLNESYEMREKSA